LNTGIFDFIESSHTGSQQFHIDILKFTEPEYETRKVSEDNTHTSGNKCIAHEGYMIDFLENTKSPIENDIRD